MGATATGGNSGSAIRRHRAGGTRRRRRRRVGDRRRRKGRQRRETAAPSANGTGGNGGNGGTGTSRDPARFGTATGGRGGNGGTGRYPGGSGGNGGEATNGGTGTRHRWQRGKAATAIPVAPGQRRRRHGQFVLKPHPAHRVPAGVRRFPRPAWPRVRLSRTYARRRRRHLGGRSVDQSRVYVVGQGGGPGRVDADGRDTATNTIVGCWI